MSTPIMSLTSFSVNIYRGVYFDWILSFTPWKSEDLLLIRRLRVKDMVEIITLLSDTTSLQSEIIAPATSFVVHTGPRRDDAPFIIVMAADTFVCVNGSNNS